MSTPVENAEIGEKTNIKSTKEPKTSDKSETIKKAKKIRTRITSKKASAVLNHFTLNKTTDKLYCNYCSKPYKSPGNHQSLSRHMKLHHPAELNRNAMPLKVPTPQPSPDTTQGNNDKQCANNELEPLKITSLPDIRVPTLYQLCIRKIRESKSEGLVSSSTFGGDREVRSLTNCSPTMQNLHSTVQPLTTPAQNASEPLQTAVSSNQEKISQVQDSPYENLMYQKQLIHQMYPYLYPHHPSLPYPYGNSLHPYLMQYSQHPYYSNMLQNYSKMPIPSHYPSHIPTEVNSQAYSTPQNQKVTPELPDTHQSPPQRRNSSEPLLDPKMEEIIAKQHQLALEKRRSLEYHEQYYANARYQQLQQLQQKQHTHPQKTDQPHQSLPNETSLLHSEGSSFDVVQPRTHDNQHNSASHIIQNRSYPISSMIPPRSLQHPYYNVHRDPNRSYAHDLSYYYGQNYEHQAMAHPTNHAAGSRLQDDALRHLLSGQTKSSPVQSQDSATAQHLPRIPQGHQTLPTTRENQYLIVEKDLICYTCEKLVNPFNAVAHLYFGPVKCLQCGKKLSCLEPADIDKNSCPHKSVDFIYTNPLIYLIRFLPSKLKSSNELFVEYLKKLMPVCRFHPWRKQFQKLIISMKITSQAIITAKKTNDSKVRFKPNGIFWTANSENVELLKLLNDIETLSLEKIYEEIAKKITDPELINAIGQNKFNDNYTKANNFDGKRSMNEIMNQKHSFHDQKSDDVTQPIEVDICSSSSDEEVPLQIVEDDDDQVSKGKHKVKKTQRNVRNSYYFNKDLSPNNEWTDRTALIHGVESRIKVRMDNNTVLKNYGEKGVLVEEPILEIKIPEHNILSNNSKYLINTDDPITMKKTLSIDNLQSNSRVDHIKDRRKVANKSIDNKQEKSNSFSINNENLKSVKTKQGNKEEILVKENTNKIKYDKNQTKREKSINVTNDKSKVFQNSQNDTLHKDKYLEKNYTYDIGKNQSITGTIDKNHDKVRNLSNDCTQINPLDMKNNLIEIKYCKELEDKSKITKENQFTEENDNNGSGKQVYDMHDKINEEDHILTGKMELLKSTENLEERKNEVLDYQGMLKAHMLLRDESITLNDKQSTSNLNENLNKDNINVNLNRNEDNSLTQLDNRRKEDSFIENIKELKKIEKKTEIMNQINDMQNYHSKDVNNKNNLSNKSGTENNEEKSDKPNECIVSSVKCIEKLQENCNVNIKDIGGNTKNYIIQESRVKSKEIECSVPIEKENRTSTRKPESDELEDKEYLNISDSNDNVKSKEIIINMKNTHFKGLDLIDEKNKETKLDNNFSSKAPNCYNIDTVLKENEQNLNQKMLKESISINLNQAYSKCNIESERKRKHSFNKETKFPSNDKERISKMKYKLKKGNCSNTVKSFKDNNKVKHKHHKSKDKIRKYKREESLVSKDKCKEVIKHNKLYKKQKYRKNEDKMSILDIIKEGIIEHGQKLKNTDSYSKSEYKKENKKTKLLHSVFNNWSKCNSEIHKKNSSTSKDKSISNNVNKEYNPTQSLAVIEKLHILKKHVIYRMDEIHGEIENVVWTRDKIHRKMDLVKAFIETDGYNPRKVDHLKRDSNDKVETVLFNKHHKSEQTSSLQKYEEFSNKNNKSEQTSNGKDIKPSSNHRKFIDNVTGETKSTEVNSISNDLNIAKRKYKWKIEDIQKISKKIQSAKERIKRQMEILKGYMEDSLHSNEEINHIQEDSKDSQNKDHLKDKEELHSNKKEIELSTPHTNINLGNNTEKCSNKDNDNTLGKLERKGEINDLENNDNESSEEELDEDLPSDKLSKDFLAQFNTTMSEIQKAREDIQHHMEGEYEDHKMLNNNSKLEECKFKILNIESEENKRPVIAKIILKEIRKVRKQLKEQRINITNSNDKIFKAREKLNSQMKLMQLDLDQFQNESKNIYKNENIKRRIHFVEPTTEIPNKKHSELYEERDNENKEQKNSEEQSCIQTNDVETNNDMLDDIESHLRYLDSTDSNESNGKNFTLVHEKKDAIDSPTIQMSKCIANTSNTNTPTQSSEVVEGVIGNLLLADSSLENSEDQNFNEKNVDSYTENMDSNECEMKNPKIETTCESSQFQNNFENIGENEKVNVDKICGEQPSNLRKSTNIQCDHKTNNETSMENQIEENHLDSNQSLDTHLAEDSINIEKEEQQDSNNCHSSFDGSQLKDKNVDTNNYDQEDIDVTSLDVQTKNRIFFEKDDNSTFLGNYTESSDEKDDKKDDDQEKIDVISLELQTKNKQNYEKDNNSTFLVKDEKDNIKDDDQEKIDVTSLDSQTKNIKNYKKDDNSTFLENQTDSSDVTDNPSSLKEKEITMDFIPIRKKRKLPPLRPIYEVNSKFKYLKKEHQIDSDITDSNSSDSNEVKDYSNCSTSSDGNICEKNIIGCDNLPCNIKNEFPSPIKEEPPEKVEQFESINGDKMKDFNLDLNKKGLKLNQGEAVSEKCKTDTDNMLEVITADTGVPVSETIKIEKDIMLEVNVTEKEEAVTDAIKIETESILGITVVEKGVAVSETIKTETDSMLEVIEAEKGDVVPETIKNETDGTLGVKEEEIVNNDMNLSLDKSELLKFKRENVDLAESNIYVSYRVIKRCPVCRIKVNLICDKDNQMLKTVCFCGLTIYVLLDPDDEDNLNGYQTDIIKRRSKRIKNESDGQDNFSGYQTDKAKRRSNRIKNE